MKEITSCICSILIHIDIVMKKSVVISGYVFMKQELFKKYRGKYGMGAILYRKR